MADFYHSIAAHLEVRVAAAARLRLGGGHAVGFKAERCVSEGPRAVDSFVHTLLTYTIAMSMTTIRVEAEVRDRLAAQAEAHGRSLGAELRAMLDEMMWQGIEAGYRRLATHPQEMAAYQADAAAWISAGLDGLAATAAEEYPEYNS